MNTYEKRGGRRSPQADVVKVVREQHLYLLWFAATPGVSHPIPKVETVNCKLSTVNCRYGFAVGEKNPIGKSFAVRSPAGASRITGIEFTATDAVAMSP